MDVQVIYNAPLEAGFSGGTLELKRDQVYIDAQGRKAPAYQQATIAADRSLTDVQTGLPLRTIAQGPGDPPGGPIDWVETLHFLDVAGQPLPDAKRQHQRLPGAQTRPGVLDLHRPAGPDDAPPPPRDPRLLPSVYSGVDTAPRTLDFWADPGRPLTSGSVENLGQTRFQARLHYAWGVTAPFTLPERSSREWQGAVTGVTLLPLGGQAMDWQVSGS